MAKKKQATKPAAREMVSLRLSQEVKSLIERIAAHHGVTKTSVIEMSVREYARNLFPRDSGQH